MYSVDVVRMRGGNTAQSCEGVGGVCSVGDVVRMSGRNTAQCFEGVGG